MDLCTENKRMEKKTTLLRVEFGAGRVFHKWVPWAEVLM